MGIFEKIFGTSAYADIEECLKNKYNLSYCEAKDVLYYTNNKFRKTQKYHIINYVKRNKKFRYCKG